MKAAYFLNGVSAGDYRQLSDSCPKFVVPLLPERPADIGDPASMDLNVYVRTIEYYPIFKGEHFAVYLDPTSPVNNSQLDQAVVCLLRLGFGSVTITPLDVTTLIRVALEHLVNKERGDACGG